MSVSFSAGLLAVTGDANSNDIDISFSVVSSTKYVIVKEAGTTIYDGTPTGQNVLSSAVTAVSVTGGNGNDTIELTDVATANGFAAGLDEQVTLEGGSGNDTILGSEFGDWVRGGSGDDSLLGGLGNEHYLFADSAGTDIVNDSAGDSDTVVFSELTAAVTVDLSSSTGQTIASGTTVTFVSAAIEGVIGTAQNDTLTGNANANILVGLGGNDALSGGDGDDWYIYVDTSQGSDTITEGANDDFDVLSFYDFGAAVTVDLSSTSAQSVGGSTTITLSSATGIERVIGSANADTLTGNSRDNSFAGGAGNDTMTGGTGSDAYFFIGAGSLGSDRIVEGADADADALIFEEYEYGVTIDVSSTSPQAIGGSTTITLTSAAGIEIVVGSGLADSLTGNTRDNVFYGMGGNDTLTGGSGNDAYAYDGSSLGSDLIVEAPSVNTDTIAFEGSGVGITIDLSSTSAQSIGGSTTITLSSATGIENVLGSAFADSITGNTRENGISGGDGADTIAGGTGNDTLTGGAGADRLSGAEGDDSLAGGSGDDTYVLGSAAQGSDTLVEAADEDYDIIDFASVDVAVTVDLSSAAAQSWGDGTMTLSSATGLEIVIGGAFSDIIGGNARTNYLVGLDGNDTLAGSGEVDFLFGDDGADSLQGGEGDDYLDGWDGHDSLFGGNGADTLLGRLGNDSLVGEGGNDWYQFLSDASDADAIVESANADRDYVDFSSADVGVSIDLSSTGSQSWGDGTIALSSGAAIEIFVASNGANIVMGNARDNVLVGGSGNDSFVGGNGSDVLYGGSGNDTLDGSAGRDLLAGGLGSDLVQGGTDDDVLGAAWIYFGEDHLTILSAIDQILQEWTSASSYAVRQANLRDSTGATNPLKDETVFDTLDSSADTLEGGAGDDLFFLDVGEDNSDATPGETEVHIG